MYAGLLTWVLHLLSSSHNFCSDIMITDSLLQWRDRTGLTPVSLFILLSVRTHIKYLIIFNIMVHETTVNSIYKKCLLFITVQPSDWTITFNTGQKNNGGNPFLKTVSNCWHTICIQPFPVFLTVDISNWYSYSFLFA